MSLLLARLGTTYTKAGALVSDLNVLAADVFTASETGAVVSNLDTAGADAFTRSEAGSVVSDANLSAAELQEAAETGAIVSDLDLSASDVQQASETGAITAANSLLFGADIFEAADSGKLILDADLAGSDVFSTEETGAVVSDTDLSGSELQEASESGSVISDASLSGSDLTEQSDAGSIISDLDVSGSKTGAFARAGKVVSDANASGSDVFEASEAGRLESAFATFGADVFNPERAGAVVSDAVLSGKSQLPSEITTGPLLTWHLEPKAVKARVRISGGGELLARGYGIHEEEEIEELIALGPARMRDFPDVSWAGSALLLYGAGFCGWNDGRWVREDGVRDVTVVDIDTDLLAEMEETYPASWEFVCCDAITFITDAVARAERWDLVVADPFGGGSMVECHGHLDKLFRIGEKVIIGAERTRALPEGAVSWPRAGDTGEYCWWVFE